MKLLVSILQACMLITWAECKPADHGSLPHPLQRRTGDCDDLAMKTDKILNYWVINELQHSRMPVSKLRKIFLRVTGSDILQGSQVRRIVCRLLDASSLSGIRQALDELNITYSGFRFGYDMGIAAMGMAKDALQNEPGHQDDWSRQIREAALDLFEQIEAAGLDQLDPEGTEWVKENVFPGPRPPPRRQWSKGLSKRQSPDSCERFYSTVNTLIDLTVFNKPFPYPPPEEIVRQVQDIFGIDLENPQQIREISCAMLEIQSVQDIIELLDSYQILDHAMAAGYSYGVGNGPQARAYFQDILNRAEEAENAGGASPWLKRQAALAKAFILFYDSMEAHGLFSLDVDLPVEP